MSQAESEHASPEARPGEERIPRAVIRRLSLYSRALAGLEQQGVECVSSMRLASLLGLKPALVRKDLAYFGQFGMPGLGYHVADLRSNLTRILGTDREVRVALVGLGHLGKALVSYGGFGRQGFRICCAFDVRLRTPTVGPNRIPAYHIDELEARVAEHRIEMGVLTVTADAAQGVATRLVAAGVTGILNFVPRRIEVAPPARVHNVDLAIEMESLAYYLK